MARTGTWLLGAGLLLLVAGIINAPSWKSERIGHDQTIPAAGIDTLELGDLRLEVLQLDQVEDLGVTYRFWQRQAQPEELVQIVSREAGTLELAKNEAAPWAQITLEAPNTLQTVRGDAIPVMALQPIESLRLEGRNVEWKQGDAGLLDVRLRPGPQPDCQGTLQPRFTFGQGAVKQLRVHAGSGSITLRDISQVDDIELHIGPEVRLSARYADLPRLRVVALEPSETEQAADAIDCPQGGDAYPDEAPLDWGEDPYPP